MKKVKKSVLIVLSSIVLVTLSFTIVNGEQGSVSVSASATRPSGMAISSRVDGMKGIDIFMNKSTAKNYASKISHVDTGTLALSNILGATLTKANPYFGSLLTIADEIGNLESTLTANWINKTLKNHNGIYVEIKGDSFQPGGSHIGGWNGKTSTAKSISKAGGSEIIKTSINE